MKIKGEPPMSSSLSHQDRLERSLWDSISSLPPLDQLTVCSGDDDSSVSTISSTDEDFREDKPRSIFRSYWEKKGGRYAKKDIPVSVPLTPFSPTSVGEELNSKTYERSLKLNEIAPPSSDSRRRIFGKMSSSPTLSLAVALEMNFRKTQSASSLPGGKPTVSCLRPSRYSGNRRRNSDASDASVSFSSKVDVVVFQTPREQWAPEGWSNWFA
jgi:hypothetical protein